MIQSFFKIFKKNTRRETEIFPDEVLLDAENLPKFDVYQFEGRLEKSISHSTYAWLIIFAILVGGTFIFRLGILQIKQGDAYALKSEKNSLKQKIIIAKRGVIYDRNKLSLAWNTENLENSDFPLRAYATSSGLSHVIGYVKYPQKDSSGIYYQNDYVGKDGVEKFYDGYLSGYSGIKIVETDALGKVISESTQRLPQDGKNLTLSIDGRVQEEFFNIIGATVRDFGFSGGSGAILDVNTGELLALVSYPEYSSYTMADGKDTSTIYKYLNDPSNSLLNRAVSGLYAPGSVIKPFLATAALSLKVIDPLKQIESTGSISIPNPYDPTKSTIFRDWKALGWLDMRHAIAMSSDVYFYTIGGGFGGQAGLGIANIEKYARLFGLGTTTGVDLPGESDGVIPSPLWKAANFNGEKWYLGDTYHSAIGQYGFQVTPIQMIRGVSAIANGGFLVTPTVVLGQEKKNPKINLGLNPSDLQIVREGMRLGVLEGTSKNLNLPFVKVAGKTGTAELGVSKANVNSWAMGFFPYDHPKYAYVVTMERGSVTNTTGGVYVMLNLLDWMETNTPEYLH